MLFSSTNDVYEIFDYSDVETESSHTESGFKSEAPTSSEKLNMSSFKSGPYTSQFSPLTPTSKPYIKEHFMESNSDNETDEFRLTPRDDDKKLLKETQMNNLKSSKEISTPTRLSDFSNPVIKNYLKAKEQQIGEGSSRKMNDLSKKPKNFQDLVKTKLNNQNYPTAKSAPPKSMRTNFERPKKPQSAAPKTPQYGRQDSTLNEFQIEKVVSWMTVNDDNFESEFEYSVAGPENEEKTGMTKGETTYKEITEFIKGKDLN